jgi:hypothetical protein
MSQPGIDPIVERFVSESDYVELSRLVIEHAWTVDNGRADTVHELYVDDGVLDVGTPVRGRQAIREWGRRLVAAPPWRIIRHACSNMRFLSDGPDAAHGTSVLTVFMVVGAGSATTLPFNVGEDHDQFTRTKQGWKLVSRRWVELYTRGDALNLP